MHAIQANWEDEFSENDYINRFCMYPLALQQYCSWLSVAGFDYFILKSNHLNRIRQQLFSADFFLFLNNLP